MSVIVDHVPLPGKGNFYTEEVRQWVKHRRAIGKTQAELAREMGFSRYYIILMEQGKIDPTRLLNHWKK